MATATKSRIGANGSEPSEQIQIVSLNIREFDLPIRGVTPLITHKKSQAMKDKIETKEQGKATGGRKKRNPLQECKDAIYLMPGSTGPDSKKAEYGLPAAGFKNGAVAACRYIEGMKMVSIKGAFRVLDDGGGLVRMKTKSGWKMRDDWTIIGQGVPHLKYRPEFEDWSCILRIIYNASSMSAEQIINLFNYAGFHVGWGELRPQQGYSNGMYEVVTKK